MIPRIPIVKEIDYETELTKILNSYIYHNVHCRPYSEYRHNIQLFPLFPTTQVNIVNIASASTRLPASGRWFLYTVENNAIVSIKLPLGKTWTVLGDYYDTRQKKMITGYCTSSGVDIRVVLPINGKCIPRHCVWILKNPKANNFIVAIRETVISQFLGEPTATPPTINLNFYYHKADEYFRVVGYTNNRLSERNTFFDDCNAASDATKIIFIDGVECVPKNLEDVFTGCFGEIVYDSSIVGTFKVDISPENSTIYINNRAALKYLCHIPKELNPDNDILNHRICDIYVHPEGEQTTNYTNGLYINRTNTEKLFTTVSHNDFSIEKSLITHYCTLGLFGSKCQLKIYVRNHHKGFTLNKDPNYFRELYLFDDNTIIQHLLGNTGQTYWAAKNTEDSDWVYFMDHYLEGITADDITKCVDCLGYTLSANALAKRVQHILISNELRQSEFFIPIPICYMTVENLICHVFVDGVRLDNDNFKYERVNQLLKIYNLTGVKFTVGTRITVELFEASDYRANYVTLGPAVRDEYGNWQYDSVSFDPEHGYEIYREVPLSSTNYIQNKYIYSRFIVNESYRTLTETETDAFVEEEFDEATNTTTVTITNRSTVGMKLLITSKTAYAKLYGVERHLKELNYDIWCSHRLMIKAKSFVINHEFQYEGEQLIPYINTDRTMLVYLNGRELTRSLDYQDYQINTNRNCIAGQFVILQNVDYLRVASNTFEVFTINERQVNLDTGFLTKNQTETIPSRMGYYDNLSMIFVDGYAQQYYDDHSYYVSIDQTIRPGSPYKIRTLVPRCLDEILSQLVDVDTGLQNTIARYVENQQDSATELVSIDRSHHIYSTFIQTITEQVLRGKLKVKLSWTDNQIRAKLASYLDMMEFDLAFNQKNRITSDPATFAKKPAEGLDLRFVDVLPSYRLERLEDTDLTITEKRPIILVTNSNVKTLNVNYICANPGARYMTELRGKDVSVWDIPINSYTARRWEASNGSYIVHRYTNLQAGKATLVKRWELRDANDVLYYTAEDAVGVKDPAELKWEPVLKNYGEIRVNTALVEVNTSNEFPIHRLQFTRSIEEYAFLMRVAKMYLKQDLAKDGMNI